MKARPHIASIILGLCSVVPDTHAQEAKAAVAKNPIGSNWLEKTDCAKLEPIFAKYTKK